MPGTRTLVLLDTNALLMPFRSGVPLRQEIERLVGPATIAVPAAALRELRGLAERHVAFAPAALTWASSLPILLSPGRGDRAVLDLAQRRRAVVVTADRDLAERLTAVGRTVLMPRDRTHLVRRPAATVKSRSPVVRPSRGERTTDDRRRPPARRSGAGVRERRHRGL